MNKTKDCLPEPIDGITHLEASVTYRIGPVLPNNIKFKLPIYDKNAESLAIEKSHKEQMVKV